MSAELVWSVCDDPDCDHNAWFEAEEPERPTDQERETDE